MVSFLLLCIGTISYLLCSSSCRASRSTSLSSSYDSLSDIESIEAILTSSWSLASLVFIQIFVLFTNLLYLPLFVFEISVSIFSWTTFSMAFSNAPYSLFVLNSTINLSQFWSWCFSSSSESICSFFPLLLDPLLSQFQYKPPPLSSFFCVCVPTNWLAPFCLRLSPHPLLYWTHSSSG